MKKGYYKDLTGCKFGMLTVREFLRIDEEHGAIWLCDCECGNTVEVSSRRLSSKNTKSCGCLRHTFKRTHGLSNTRLYDIWCHTRSKCTKPNDRRYEDYGARGISVCDEWANDFMSFYNWAMNNGYEDNLSLDRIDVDGNYEPSNCRWADDYTQTHNRRLDKLYTYNGKTLSVRDWCKEIGFYWSIFGINTKLPKEEKKEPSE